MSSNILLMLILVCVVVVGLSYISILLCEQIKFWNDFSKEIDMKVSIFVLGIIDVIVDCYKNSVTENLSFVFGHMIGMCAAFFLFTAIAVLIRRNFNNKDSFEINFERASILSFACAITSMFF
jgi:xanthine/uracil permease